MPINLSSALVPAAAFIVGFFVLPLVLSALWVKVVTLATLYGLAAAGIGLVFSQLGLISLAQIALLGVGGWIALRLNYATGIDFTSLVLIAGLCTAVIGGLLALPAMRVRGLYLALVTLMAAGGAQILFNAFQFPNGGPGFWGVAQQSAAEVRRPGVAISDAAYLRYSVVMVTLGFLLIWWHKRNGPGRAWMMIRQSEANAMAAGIDVIRMKLWAFALAGFLAGVSGALLSGALLQLDARSFMASDGILLFALCVVGGVQNWRGALIAGVLFKLVPSLFNDWGLSADIALILFGAALLHAITTAPRGIAGQLDDLFGRKEQVR